jgi:hypothetical protein
VPFVRTGVFGAQLGALPEPSVIVTDDWWLYSAALSALNCPRLPDCPVLFALANSSTPDDMRSLHVQFPNRVIVRAVNRAGEVELQVPNP